MLKVKLAKHIGFCSGVQRAIRLTEEALTKSRVPVYSLGSIIHNPQELNRLTRRGLRLAHTVDEVPKGACVILPSHGTRSRTKARMRARRLTTVDVTCPYVSSVHKICQALHRRGVQVVIVGDSDHPEVKAIVDLVPGARVIESAKEVPAGTFNHKRIGIISQTTQSRDNFLAAIFELLRKNSLVKEVHVFNTICLDTLSRQEEVRLLATQVDRMFVIGSSTSANTKRLVTIGKRYNPETYLVETKDAIMPKMLINARTIGIISGASAPDWLAHDIIAALRKHSEGGTRTCRKNK